MFHIKILCALLLLLNLKYTNSLFPSLPISIVLKILASGSMNLNCVLDLKSLYSDFEQGKMWSTRMLDASGKPPPGLLEGNLHILGEYDLCLSIKENVKDRQIEGKYCTVLVNLNHFDIMSDLKIKRVFKKLDKIDLHILEIDTNNLTVPWGVCIPKSCSANDLNYLLGIITEKVTLPFNATFVENLCTFPDRKLETGALDLLIYCFFALITILIIGGTVYDIYVQWSDMEHSSIISIFSIWKSLNKFNDESDSCLRCLDGIKVISCGWLILGNVVFALSLTSKNSLYFVQELLNRTTHTFYLAANFSIDTFLTLTGILTSYIYLTKSDRLPINLFQFYTFRTIRILPILVATVFFHVSVLKTLMDGPYGLSVIESLTYDCPTSWWKPLFFLSNYGKQCVQHTWYTSVDMQFYFVAPLFLFFIKSKPKRVFIGITAAFICCILYNCITTATMQLGAVFYEINEEYTTYLYQTVMFHMPCWLIGLLFGYFIYLKRDFCSKKVHFVLRFVSLFVMYKLIVEQMLFVHGDYNEGLVILWNGFARPLWALAVSFIIYSCGLGHGGLINTFLSQRAFRVLSKLTYCMYLTHFAVIIWTFGIIRETIFFESFQVLSRFSGVYLLTVLFALLLYLTFQAPISALLDYFGEYRKLKK